MSYSILSIRFTGEEQDINTCTQEKKERRKTLPQIMWMFHA